MSKRSDDHSSSILDGIITFAIDGQEVDKEKIRKLNEIYNSRDEKFGELTYGYVRAVKWLRKEEIYGNDTYKLGKEWFQWVDMSRKRVCSYQKFDEDTKTYKSVPILDNPLPSVSSKISPVEYRGITLRQLRAVLANVVRRCEREGWVNIHEGVTTELTENTVTLYNVNKYVIMPFTEEKKLSFVSCLPSTAGDQAPRFFASHWWGEPLIHFVSCIEQLVRDNGRNKSEKDDRRGGGITEDTPIWICAYANNQHRLHESIPDDPKETGFAKAMKVAKGRTITILDKNGVVFTRMWCVYELDMTLGRKR